MQPLDRYDDKIGRGSTLLRFENVTDPCSRLGGTDMSNRANCGSLNARSNRERRGGRRPCRANQNPFDGTGKSTFWHECQLAARGAGGERRREERGKEHRSHGERLRMFDARLAKFPPCAFTKKGVTTPLYPYGCAWFRVAGHAILSVIGSEERRELHDRPK